MESTAASTYFNDSVSATDDAKSEYAFEDMPHHSDEKDEAKSVYAMDFETDPTDMENSMEADEVESMYAYKGTEYDNDDVESVYAFDALNEEIDSDMDFDGDGSDNGIDVVTLVKNTACDSKKVQLKADTDAKTVLRELRNRLFIEFCVMVALSLVCLFGTFALLEGRYDLLILAGFISLFSLLSCGFYNCIIRDRLQECEKRLDLASTKANAQSSEAVKGDKAN